MSSVLMFNKVYTYWIYSQSCRYFRPSFVVHLPHPSPFSKVKVQYIQTLCGLEGAGTVELCWRPYTAKFNTLFLIRFKTYKIATPPQTKTQDGRVLRHCHKVLLLVNFFRQQHLTLLSISLIFLRSEGWRIFLVTELMLFCSLLVSVHRRNNLSRHLHSEQFCLIILSAIRETRQ